jgi:hypothetical protein
VCVTRHLSGAAKGAIFVTCNYYRCWHCGSEVRPEICDESVPTHISLAVFAMADKRNESASDVRRLALNTHRPMTRSLLGQTLARNRLARGESVVGAWMVQRASASPCRRSRMHCDRQKWLSLAYKYMGEKLCSPMMSRAGRKEVAFPVLTPLCT